MPSLPPRVVRDRPRLVQETPTEVHRNFDDFGKMFLTQFMAGIVQRKPTGSLMSLHQGPEESLKNFLMHFNQERLTTEDSTKEFIHYTLFQGLKKDGPLMVDLAWKLPHNLHEFMKSTEEFINQEETLRAFLIFDPARASSSEKAKKFQD
jgi:hypothetical protein